MSVRGSGGNLYKKKTTCYLCTEKHREIGHEQGKHREFNLNLNVATHVNLLTIDLSGGAVAVSNTYQDDISNGYSIPDEKPTIGYSIPDEIPTTCFQLCELA